MIGDEFSMIKQIAWNTFKNTGDINTYLELAKFKNIEESAEENIINKASDNKENIQINTKINLEMARQEADKTNGNIEGKGNSNCGTQYGRL